MEECAQVWGAHGMAGQNHPHLNCKYVANPSLSPQVLKKQQTLPGKGYSPAGQDEHM